ncbi:MAG: response regulator [Oleispira sp.]|nr:response regulator [Oleispira sp.]MBL4881670.1 response regulator [Oleispira sp.]
MNSLKLLIVDDNATNREVLRGQLQRWEIDVVEADGGEQALMHLHSHQINKNVKPFDLAIIDMQMPGMDGTQLAELIHQDENNKDLKLIMLTSVSDNGDAQYFAKKGFSAYFSKPIISSDLYDALAIIVEDGKALEQAQPLLTHHYLQSLDHSNNIVKQSGPNAPRLLLVEDNYINQEVALCILESIGLTADVANDGEEALEILNQASAENSYDLILMDCQMPKMDGYLTTQNIRNGKAGAHHQQIPIIAMTANAMKGDSDKCFAAGMNHYLTKPFEADDFNSLLRLYFPSIA